MNLPTILYAENDPVALTMYQKRLEREGFHLETAQDGMQALESITREVPDLLLLDLMLPTLSGADVLRFVYADPKLRSMPVIIFSNAPKTEVPEEVKLEGPVRFLAKADCPFPLLLENIQQLLRSAAAGDTAPAPAAAGQPAPQPKPASDRPVTAESAGTNGANSAAKDSPARDFLNQPSPAIESIRQHCFGYVKSPNSAPGREHLFRLRQCVESLGSQTVEPANARAALLTKAFVALLAELAAQSWSPRPSALQAVAQAVDCLDLLLKAGKTEAERPLAPAKVLAVDDDAVCNHVMGSVLKRAGFDSECVQAPKAALELLRTRRFDVILLDIDMPEMTGFELCEKLRRLPHCKTVPVIFVTAHNNFENRKHSVLIGAHDFVAKPVVAAELTLQITLHLLKHQTDSPDAPLEPESCPSTASTTPADSTPPKAAAVSSATACPAPPALPQAKTEPPKPVVEDRPHAENLIAPAVVLPALEAPPSKPAEIAPPKVAPVPAQDVSAEPPATAPLSAASPAPEPAPIPLPAAEVPNTTSAPSCEQVRTEPQPRAPETVSATALESATSQPASLPPAVSALPAVEPAPPKLCLPAPQPEPPQAVALPAPEPPPAQPPAAAPVSAELPPAAPAEATLSQAPLTETMPSTNQEIMQKAQNPTFDKIVNEVARIVFGDDNINELNLRLIRLALESAKIHELVGNAPAAK